MKKLLLNSIVMYAVFMVMGLIAVPEALAGQQMIITTEWEKDVVFEDGKSVSIENIWTNNENEIEFAGVSYVDRKEPDRQIYSGKFSRDGKFISRHIGDAPDFWHLTGMVAVIRNITAVYETKYSSMVMVGNFREFSERNQPPNPLHEIEKVTIYQTPDLSSNYRTVVSLTKSIVLGKDIYYCGSKGLFKTTKANKVLWFSLIKDCKKNETYFVTDMAVVEGQGIYTVGLFGETESKFGLKSPAGIVVSKFDFNGRFIDEKIFQTGVGTFNFPKISTSNSGVFVAYMNSDITKIPSLENEKQQQPQGCAIGTSNKKNQYYQITSLDSDLNVKWDEQIGNLNGAPPTFTIDSSDDYVFISYIKSTSSQICTELVAYSFSGKEIARMEFDAYLSGAKLFAVESNACVMVGQMHNIAKTTTVGAIKVKVTAVDPANKPKIGVYDSRSLAIAFVGSKQHEAIIDDLTRKIEQAKADGDDKKAERLKKSIERTQNTLHRQAFGTESAHYYLWVYYPKELSALKEKLGLDRVVSVWNKESLSYYKDFQQIDVTEQVIEIPEPNDKQRRSALEIRKHQPLTDEELEKNKSSL
ncbi:MAG: hypothetical protein FVQ79_04820 [Planctomycetes bacterium]|nr:hypothetical protein [Planctomycetota bacterium]